MQGNKSLHKAQVSRFRQDANYVRTVHHLSVECSTPFEEILKPEFYAHIAAHLRPGSRIEVIPDDCSYMAEMYVVACDRLWAKVVLLHKHDLTGGVKAEPVSDDFEVKYSGPHTMFRVVRKSDKGVIKDGFQTKEMGEAWLADYRTTIQK